MINCFHTASEARANVENVSSEDVMKASKTNTALIYGWRYTSLEMDQKKNDLLSLFFSVKPENEFRINGLYFKIVTDY